MAGCMLCKSTENLWPCDQCHGKVCETCSKLTASEIKCLELRKGRILRFYCKTCEKDLISEVKKLRRAVGEQSTKIETLTTEIAALNTKFQNLEEHYSKQSDNLEIVTTEIKNNAENKLLYSEVAANTSGEKRRKTKDFDSVIIVKPKEVQESRKTKKEIKEKIDLSRLGAGVSGVKELSRGQVIIRCGNEGDREKIESKIQEEMSDNYETKAPNLKFPKIKVVGINEDDDNTDEGLVEAILEQNLQNRQQTEDDFHMKIIKRLKKKMKNNYQLL
ncbi:hypothetical protein NQ317_000183 [Molorchus minor]|uniref:B box-type domain-containing protein n=1 Tax=Molorchus minor TaxID=1323400 RepID=A0ABQ9J6S4_9CUCU|nr:hypothetical protein NQ317_000183 [Molorchus minor]